MWGRITWVALIGASAALLVASIERAATFPFVYDESMSYSILTWNPDWRFDANHHPLNTLLMRACASLFGPSELALRAPNLLAFVLYVASVLLVLKRVPHLVLRLAGFALFVLNPFLVDFFSFARGYGLALAFQMLSLYFLVRAWEERTVRFVVAAVAAGALAVVANYAFLNFFLPLLAILAWLMRKHVRQAFALYASAGVFLVLVGRVVLRLQREGQLYFGGRDGFLSDTVVSLVRTWLYRASYADVAEPIAVALVVVFFNGLLFLSFRREVTLFTLLVVMLTAAILLPIAQHALLGMHYPLDRAALCYVPLFALALVFGLQRAMQLAPRAVALPVLLAVALAWHCVRTVDPSTCYLWPYDAHSDEVEALIERDRARWFAGSTVRVTASWMLEPSLNFYRYTRGHDALTPVSKQPILNGGYDYLYAFENDLADVPPEIAPAHRVVLASFPDTKTVLVRIHGAR